MYIEREVSDKLLKLSKKYPVISLTGPRQSGKTTLVKKTFPKMKYYSLENPDNLEFALSDPRSFLNQSADGMIIDEAQKAPELFSYIQEIVDTSNKSGMYILTGSQNFLLLEKITQSLAGRTAILKLLPFSQTEFSSINNLKMSEQIIIDGMYPPIHDRRLDPGEWYANYTTTYIEKDVRSILNIGDLNMFQNFLKLTAGRSGQILNYSSIANDCGISHNTAKSWISILEASYIISLLPPYYNNFNKRIIKAPKLYFLDTGLLCYLLGIPNLDVYNTHYSKGAVFETYIYSELMKIFINRGEKPEIYYWRDKTGNEVDFIIPLQEELISLEVKSGKTITKDYFKGINYWQKLTGYNKSCVIYGGYDEQERSNCRVLPWNRIEDLV